MLKFLVLNGKLTDFSLTELNPYLNSRSKWSVLLKTLIQKPLSSTDIASLSWVNEIEDQMQSEVREWVLLENSPRVESDESQVWKDLVKRVQTEFFEEQSRRIQEQLMTAEQNKSESEVRRLLSEKRDLVEMMKLKNEENLLRE